MATYYIRKTGNNSNAGTSAGAAWLTLAKALGSGTTVASGDTVYIGAGRYAEEITCALPSSPASQISFIGDVDGVQTGDAGDVVWTAYTSGDTSSPASRVLSLSERKNLRFENLIVVCGTDYSGGIANTSDTGTQDLVFRNCVFLSAGFDGFCLNLPIPYGAGNITVDRCVFYNPRGSGSRGCIRFNFNRGAADYDSNIAITNCMFVGSNGVHFQGTGAGAGYGGGIDVLGCSFISMVNGVYAENNEVSSTYPMTVYGCLISGNCGLRANTTGKITEDYNVFYCETARSNVSTGTNSKTGTGAAPLLELGQSLLYRRLRPPPLFTPSAGSPLLSANAYGSMPSVDLLNRPRPAGGSITAAYGALELHDQAAVETTTVRTGSRAMKIVGPGDVEFQLAVDAEATTISIYARYDTNHGTTNKPQMQVLDGAAIGVSDATDTMTAAVDTWEELSLSFTPTAAGVITVRLRSRAAAANGNAFFDDVTVT